MQEEVGAFVLEFLESKQMLEHIESGAKGLDLSTLARKFAEEYPSEDPFEAQYAMEYLAGRSDVLHAQRTAMLRRVSKKYGAHKSRELRGIRATAVAAEAIIKDSKLELVERYFAAAEKEKNATSKEEIHEQHKEKGLVREDLDALRELSKAGITTDPLVLSALNRMVKEEEKQQEEGTHNLGRLKKFVETLL